MLFRAVLALLVTLCVVPALAQEPYPSRPVTLVVAYAPGGMTDIVTRKVASVLQQRFGQPFVVDNKPGATGQIATDYVAKRPADGYTLLVGATSHVINPALKKSLPYDARKAFDPVALLAISPNFVLVNPKLNITTFKEFVAYGKTNPSMPYGSAGIGGAPHIVGELLKIKSGLPLLHIAYRGAGPAMLDLMAGQVPFGISESVTAYANLKAGKVLPLAVASAKRSATFPDVPTLQELGFEGFDLSTWVGVYAPAGTPPAILEKLNAAFRAAVAEPDVADYIRSTGSEPGDLDLAAYRTFVNNEMDKWKSVIETAGITDE